MDMSSLDSVLKKVTIKNDDGSSDMRYYMPWYNKEEKKSVKHSKMELIKNKEYINENTVHNEEPEEGNPAYRKADDPDKGLNYIYD